MHARTLITPLLADVLFLPLVFSASPARGNFQHETYILHFPKHSASLCCHRRKPVSPSAKVHDTRTSCMISMHSPIGKGGYLHSNDWCCKILVGSKSPIMVGYCSSFLGLGAASKVTNKSWGSKVQPLAPSHGSCRSAPTPNLSNTTSTLL